MMRFLLAPAVRAAAAYAVFAAVWVGLSDFLLEFLVHDVTLMSRISTLKGWIFVAVTAGLLYLLVARLMRYQVAQNERLAQSERFLSVATEGAGVGVWSWDLVERAGAVNDGFAHMLGYALSDLGRIDRRRWLELVHPDDYAATLAARRAHLAGETPYFESEVRLRHKDGHWVWVQTRGRVTARDAKGRALILSGTHVDITERHRVDRMLQRKSAMHAVLSGTNKAIVQTRDREELFETVCRAALELAGFRLVWIGRLQDDPMQTLLPVAVAGPAAGFLDHITIQCAEGAPTYRGPTAIAVRELRPVVVNDFEHYQGLVATDVLIPVYGLRSGMAMSVRGGGFVGCLTVYADEVGYFDAEVSALLEEVANDLSFALANIAAAEQRARDEIQLRLHARVFEESSDGMMITDSENRIVMVNRAFCALSGYSQEELRGSDPAILSSGRHDRDFFRQMWAMLGGGGYWQGEIWNRRRDGEVQRVWLTINRVLDVDGRTTHHVAVYGSFSEQRAQEQIDWLRRFDSLTGLPNRLLLEDRVSEAVTHARQYGRHVALLALNLDRFRYVNESLGHVTGDSVLRRVATRLTECVPETATVSRLAGDSFAILLPDLNEASAVIGVSECLLKAVSSVGLDGTAALSLTASIGVALFPADGTDFPSLLQKSETALVRLREEGGNAYAFYTEDINSRARERLSLTHALRQAMDHDWFALCFQPQVSGRDGRILGVEALLRLEHPADGVISPAQFIPLAEETGLIVEIGARVLRESCRQLRAWLDAGLAPVSVAVNLSAKQMRDGRQLVAVVREALQDYAIPPHLLELEFTESMAMRDLEQSLLLMRELKEIGVSLAIDDFGTGYSSLNYLRRFPVDRIKIDQSFVANMLEGRSDEAIVQTIVVLAHLLGMRTVAEGVECEAQAEALRRIGCDVLQGYLFARPMPADSVIKMLRGTQ